MTNTHPPRAAAWLLDLFMPGDQVLGDLLEEFSALASRRGIAQARWWYWRQSVKTVPHLLTAQLRLSPWRSRAAVLTGLLWLWLVNWLVMVGFWGRYPADWPEPLRLLWLATFPTPLVVMATAFVGWIVAFQSERREMVVTTMLTLTAFALRLAAFFIHWRAGRPGLWFAFLAGAPGPAVTLLAMPIAIFAGGSIAR